MASGGGEDGDAVGKQSEDEDKPQETSQVSEGKQEGKKRKFKPLKAMRRFFKGRKRSKTTDDQAVSIVAVRSAKSTSELLHAQGGEERPVTLAGNLSLSADSVFSPDKKKSSEVRDLKEAALSLEALNTQAINLKSAGRYSTSRRSLRSMDSSEDDIEEFYHLPKPAFSPAKKEGGEEGITAKDVDLDVVKQTSALGNVAARHKMAIRPKSRRASSQFRSPQKGEPRPVTPILPSVNEEAPPKPITKRESKEEKKTAKKFKDETDSKEKPDKEIDKVVAMETAPVINIILASPESNVEKSTVGVSMETKPATTDVPMETKPVGGLGQAETIPATEDEKMETVQDVLPKAASSSSTSGGILLQDAKPPPPLVIGQSGNSSQDEPAEEQSVNGGKDTVIIEEIDEMITDEKVDHVKRESREDEEQSMDVEVVEKEQPQKVERDIVIEPASPEVVVQEAKTEVSGREAVVEVPLPKERPSKASVRAPYDNVIVTPRERNAGESPPDKSPARRRFQDRRSRTVPTSNTQSEEITKALGQRQSFHEDEEGEEKGDSQSSPSPKPLERFAHLKKKSPSEPTKPAVVIKPARSAVASSGGTSSSSGDTSPEGSNTAESQETPTPKIPISKSVSVKPHTPSAKPSRLTMQEKVDTTGADPPWVAMAKKREQLRQQQQQQIDGDTDKQTDGKVQDESSISKEANTSKPVNFRSSLKQWQGKASASEQEKAPVAKFSFKRETSPVKQPFQKETTQPESSTASQSEIVRTSPFKQSLNKAKSNSESEDKSKINRASPFKHSLNKSRSNSESEEKEKPDLSKTSPFKQSLNKTKSNPETEEKSASDTRTPFKVTLKQAEPKGKTVFSSSTGETPQAADTKSEIKKVTSPFKASLKQASGNASPTKQSSIKRDSEKENQDKLEDSPNKFGSPLRRSLKQESGPVSSQMNKPDKPDVILRGRTAEPVINIEIIEKSPPKPKLAPVSPKSSSETTPPEKCSESAVGTRKSRVLDLVKNFQKLEVT